MPNFIALCLAFAMAPAFAADVALVGIIGDKAAVIAIDGGDPKTVKVGQTWKGVTVHAVERDRATVEIDGKKRILQQGQHYRTAANPDERVSAKIAADTRGHFITEGAINGVPVRFLVDTGATMVVLPAADALRLGLDYRKGEQGIMNTANGPASAYSVKFDRIRIGAIELANVEGVVIEQGLGVALLGMSFLNRVEMQRDGGTMTLIRRF
jgi:aspartyl protease family protein